VVLYRSGLVTAASSFVFAASYAFLPSDSLLSEIIKQNLDLLYTLGAGGLGVSLFLIHIYVTEIKRTLQAFWALGVIGSLATCTNLAQPAGENLIQYVVNNPTAVWFVGPLFAALTGLVFKEGNMVVIFCACSASLGGHLWIECRIISGYSPFDFVNTMVKWDTLEIKIITGIFP